MTALIVDEPQNVQGTKQRHQHCLIQESIVDAWIAKWLNGSLPRGVKNQWAKRNGLKDGTGIAAETAVRLSSRISHSAVGASSTTPVAVDEIETRRLGWRICFFVKKKSCRGLCYRRCLVGLGLRCLVGLGHNRSDSRNVKLLSPVVGPIFYRGVVIEGYFMEV